MAVGRDETGEFRRQSRDFLAAWQTAGLPGSWLEPPGKHHLTVLEELERADSDLTQALLRLHPEGRQPVLAEFGQVFEGEFSGTSVDVVLCRCRA